MNTDEVLIKFKEEGDNKIKLSWDVNPNTKIQDLFFAFDTAKDALVELVNKKAKKEGINSEEAFFKWLKGKTIKDVS